MVTNNKVLTVSYGTFSCTLEGFDDSFDAMKAIAEYFRDLAADDRYFGAEPPTPDAEMLARIAEREVERRVQARHEHGTLVLSAADPVVTPEANDAPVEAQAFEHEEPAEQEAPVAFDAAEEAAEELVGEALVDDAPAKEITTEDVTSDPVADVGALETAPVQDEPIETEDFNAEEPASSIAEEEDAADPYVLDASLMDEDRDEPAGNLFNDSFEEDVAPAFENIQTDAETVAPRMANATDIASKLSRIRAVVNRTEQSSDDLEDPESDADADDFLHDAAQDIEVNQIKDAQTMGETPVPAAEEDAPKPQARVIRMKKSELDDALESGFIEETETFETAEPVAPQVSTEETVAKTPDANEGLLLDTSLSSVEEAELMAELADVEAELEDVVEAPADRRDGRAAQLAQDVPQDEAVDRLIEETNSKLDEPEGNRRRTAIAHLRKAVAATKAEKEAGLTQDKADESAVYREDLADVMRPHRNVEQPYGQQRERKATPLKLVAEQRIDEPEKTTEAETKPAQPSNVRPRRVAVADTSEAETEENKKFIEYAESMGATELPDLLEAAAAYLIHVEGRRRFSRPALMRLAYLFRDKRTEREACLRSFGQLLRDGKIEKIAGGRFTVSDTINFKPQDRAAS